MPNDETKMLGVLIGLIIYVMIFLFYAVPYVIAMWKLVSKAGRPGWSQIIPVYNEFVKADIAKKPIYLPIIFAVGFILSIIPIKEIRSIGNLISAIVSLVIFLAFVKKYNMSTGKTILLLFVPIVGVFMINDVRYSGNTPKPTTPTQPPSFQPPTNQPQPPTTV